MLTGAPQDQSTKQAPRMPPAQSIRILCFMHIFFKEVSHVSPLQIKWLFWGKGGEKLSISEIK